MRALPPLSSFWVTLLLVGAALLGHAADGSPTGLGAYLGCFALPRLIYGPGMEGRTPTQHTHASIGTCTAQCRSQDFAIALVSLHLKCFCSATIPDPGARLADAVCEQPGGQGFAAAVFYAHAYAGTQKCRAERVPMTPDSFTLPRGGGQQQGITFDADDASLGLSLLPGGPRAARVLTAAPQQYGMVEVMAKAAWESAAVTSIYTRDAEPQGSAAGESSSSGSNGSGGGFSLEVLNSGPAVQGSLHLNSYLSSGDSAGEKLLKPGEYRPLLSLGPAASSVNSYITYTLDWQPDRLTWAANGVPLLTRKAGDLVKQRSIKGESSQRPWASPDRPAVLALSISPLAGSKPLDPAKPAPTSRLMDLRRVVCEPIKRGDTGACGPLWLTLGPGWTETVVATSALRGLPAAAEMTTQQQHQEQHQNQQQHKHRAAQDTAAEAVHQLGELSWEMGEAELPDEPPAAGQPAKQPPAKPGKQQPAQAACSYTVAAGAMCGGKQPGCPTGACQAAPWAGYCCGAGHVCRKQPEGGWRCAAAASKQQHV